MNRVNSRKQTARPKADLVFRERLAQLGRRVKYRLDHPRFLEEGPEILERQEDNDERA